MAKNSMRSLYFMDDSFGKNQIHMMYYTKLSQSRRLLRPLTPLTTGESDAGASMVLYWLTLVCT